MSGPELRADAPAAEWRAWRRVVAGPRPVDPYLVFAALGRFRWQVFNGDPGWLPFLVETRSGAADLLTAARGRWPEGELPLRIAPAYFDRIAASGPVPRFLVAMVRRDEARAVLGLTPVVRAQLGLARAHALGVAGTVGSDAGRETDPTTSGDAPPRHLTRPAGRPPVAAACVNAAATKGPVIAVIDDGCPFDHPALRSERGHRVTALWQQDHRPGHPAPPDLGYGRLLERTPGGWLPAAGPPPAPIQRARHARLPGHGVASWHLAAGAFDATRQDHPGAPAGDAAAQADLLAVQLPGALLDDTGCAALGVHLLDGLHFIRRQARAADPGRAVEVSLGYGTQGGPHDGTGLMDAAVAELLAADTGLHLVVAAGNSHRLACRARATIGADGRAAPLRLFVAPECPTLVVTELHFAGATADDRPVVTVTAPSGDVLRARRGEIAALRRTPGEAPVAWLVFPQRSAGEVGSGGAMALLVVAPGLPNPISPRAPSGVWRIAAEGRSGLPLQAWVERTDLANQPRRRQSAAFVGPGSTRESPAHPTVGQPASAPGVRSVGARRLSDGTRARYSSRDEARGWPLAWNAGDAAPALTGLRTPGARSHQTVRLSGTSAAAPLAARRLAQSLANARPARNGRRRRSTDSHPPDGEPRP